MLLDDALAALVTGSNRLCACGRPHRLETAELHATPGSLEGLCGYLARFCPDSPLALVADDQTWRAAGARVRDLLRAGGYEVRVCALGGGELHADEHTLGSLLIQGEGAGFLLAVGSGVINDATRYVAARTGVPYGVIATAPSMDGYLSKTSPLTRAGFKFTHPGISPSLVVADPEITATAPRALVAAGLGDLLGKYQAQLDWRIAHAVCGEWFCPDISDAMAGAADLALAAAPGAARGDREALALLTQALLLAGAGMQLAGSSRPASGCEHHMAHYWEIMEGRRGPVRLHGDKVGVGAGLACLLDEAFFRGAPPRELPRWERAAWEKGMRAHFGAAADVAIQETAPFYFHPEWPLWLERLQAQWEELGELARDVACRRERILGTLRLLDGPALPADRGSEVRDTLAWAPMVRGRMTVLSLMRRLGCDRQLEEVAAHANRG